MSTWTTTGISALNSTPIPCASYGGNVMLRSNFENGGVDTVGVGSLVSNNAPMAYIVFQESNANDTGTYFTVPLFGSVPNYQSILNYQLSQSEITSFYKTNGTKEAIGAPASTVISNFYYIESGKSFNSISIDVTYSNVNIPVVPEYLLMPGVGIIVYDGANYSGNIIVNFVNNGTYPLTIQSKPNSNGKVNDQSCKLYFTQEKTNGSYLSSLRMQDYGDISGNSSTSSDQTNSQNINNSWKSTGKTTSSYVPCTTNVSNLLIGQSFEKPGLQNGSGSSLNSTTPGAYFVSLNYYFDDDNTKVLPDEPCVGQCFYIPIFNSITDCTSSIYYSPSDFSNYYTINKGKGAQADSIYLKGNGYGNGEVVIPTNNNINFPFYPVLFLLMPNYGMKVYNTSGELTMDIINSYPFPVVVSSTNPIYNKTIQLYYVHFDSCGNFLESILIQQMDDLSASTSSTSYIGSTENEMNWLTTGDSDCNSLTYSGENQYPSIPNKGNLLVGQNFEYSGNLSGYGSVLARNIPGAYFIIQDSFNATVNLSVDGFVLSLVNDYYYTPSGYFCLPITGSISNYTKFIFNSTSNGGYYDCSGNNGWIANFPTALEIVGNSTPSAIYYLIMPNFGMKVFDGNGNKLLDIVNNQSVPIVVQSTSPSDDTSCNLYYCQIETNGNYDGVEYFQLPSI